MDEDGRPLLEQASPKYAAQELPCPYRDRRLGRPMNAAALRQVERHWGYVRETVAQCAPPDATVGQAFRASLAGYARVAQAGAVVPAPTAALYKACAGFSQVFCFLLLSQEGMADAPLSSLGGPEEFWAWLDGEGWLLGQRQVCAGSPARLRELYAAFCGGRGVGPAWLDLTREFVGLQAALALATGRSAGVGPADEGLGPDLLFRGTAPWLFPVTRHPGRPPEDVLRLFPAREVPASLREFLRQDSPSDPHREREDRFWRLSMRYGYP
ncbi:MAG: hypothetical protein AB1758_10115 [Candidatus Eremiobacterota bacterium]